MANAKKVAKRLKMELKGVTTKAAALPIIANILTTEAVVAADKPAIKMEMKALLVVPRLATPGAATGACYTKVGGALSCAAGVTESTCAATAGNVFWDEGEPCMLPVYEELQSQDLMD